MAAGLELLSVAEMYRADARAIADGVAGVDLMANAGAAVVDAIRRRWSPRDTVVLAGPGANGGDGWVVARLLEAAGWPVRIALLGDRQRLAGEAAAMVQAMNAAPAPIVAVDLPSGVNGDTGAVMGTAVQAELTVTFFRKKPGHLLAPGRFRAGLVVTADIGIPDVAASGAAAFGNAPDLWPQAAPPLDPAGHKYTRGHVLVAGGAQTTGAARLAARTALRAGAGLVTIACPAASFPVYAAAELAVMVRPLNAPTDFEALLQDKRFKTVVLGPGLGLDDQARALIELAAAAGRALVLDADALTAYADAPDRLFALIEQAPAAVLTPHDGEFKRLFGDPPGSKLARARAAAARAGAVVILKGPDTVIAAPDGRAAINANAPPTLATAGAGDVLAGMVAGLLSEGAPPFEAAAAAVWLHGAAAASLGRGLIASDLVEAIPAAFHALEQARAGADAGFEHGALARNTLGTLRAQRAQRSDREGP